MAPIAVAAFAFALSFGVLARAAGMGWLAPVVMSATTFAGSAQFAVASILQRRRLGRRRDPGRRVPERPLRPIGISVASSFEGSVAKRLVQSQLVVDESWAVALKRHGGVRRPRAARRRRAALPGLERRHGRRRCCSATRSATPNRLGLDAAFPALFLALLIPQLSSRRKLVAALLGGGIALVLIPFTPAGVPDHRRLGRVPRSAGEANERGLALRDRGRRRDDRVQGDRPGAARPRARASRAGWPVPCRTSPRPCSPPWSSRRPSPGTARSSSTHDSPASQRARSPSLSARRCSWSLSLPLRRRRWSGWSSPVGKSAHNRHGRASHVRAFFG